MSTVWNCPACGSALRVDKLGGSGGTWDRGQQFDFSVGGGLPSGASEYSREIPAADLATVASGAKLPLTQALITAGAAFLLTSVVTWYWYWSWSTPFVVSVVVGVLAWWFLLVDSRRLLRTSETMAADPGAGDPAFTVEITLPQPAGHKMLFVDFPGRPDHLRRFAQAAVDGVPTPEGARLSRRRFNGLRDECIRRGLIRWRSEHHTQGLLVTPMGKRVFALLLDGVLD